MGIEQRLCVLHRPVAKVSAFCGDPVDMARHYCNLDQASGWRLVALDPTSQFVNEEPCTFLGEFRRARWVPKGSKTACMQCVGGDVWKCLHGMNEMKEMCRRRVEKLVARRREEWKRVIQCISKLKGQHISRGLGAV